MAREAIEQVKKAEDEGRKIIEQARNAAKTTVQDGEVYSKERYRQIISDSKIEAENLMEKSKREAQGKAEPLIQKGKEQADSIRNFENSKIETAVNIVIERIVK